MARKAPGSHDLYTLKISLLNSRPPIWRRVRLWSGHTLLDLHHVIQEAMGWWDSHLAMFEAGRTEYMDLNRFGSDMDDEEAAADLGSVSIHDVLSKPKDKIVYTYDFGDDWRHAVQLEKVETRAGAPEAPECLAGKRACPKEDCGGLHGYYRLLDILADPSDEENEDMMEWAGGPIDPEYFDIDDTNRRLKAQFRNSAN